MLPETLSAEICSLKEGEDRAALACHLQVTQGRASSRSWRFSRARVRIAANIAYEDAQAAIDAARGQERIEVSLADLLDAGDRAGRRRRSRPRWSKSTLKPLWACWRALYAAREKRAPLELDLPERQVMLDEKGRITSVAPRERLDAHKLIEDYMIAANVAAAKALEAKKAPVMYRDHEPPGREKLVALKDYLKTFEVEFALGQVVRPATFNHIIERIGEADFRPQVMEQILRTQTQAYYSPGQSRAISASRSAPTPISPARSAAMPTSSSTARWSAPTGSGEGGLTDAEAEAMEVTGELISQLERRAMEAERDTLDRYVAAYLSERVGDLVDCRITGVQPFGFFATVEGLGGDGLVPVSTLGSDYFRYDEASQSLVGDDSGERFSPGQRLKLRLVEANPVSGGLRFELPEAGYTSRAPPRPAPRRPPRRGGPAASAGPPRPPVQHPPSRAVKRGRPVRWS